MMGIRLNSRFVASGQSYETVYLCTCDLCSATLSPVNCYSKVFRITFTFTRSFLGHDGTPLGAMAMVSSGAEAFG